MLRQNGNDMFWMLYMMGGHNGCDEHKALRAQAHTVCRTHGAALRDDAYNTKQAVNIHTETC